MGVLVGVVGVDLLGHRTLKSAVSQEYFEGFCWFLHGDRTSEKLKVALTLCGLALTHVCHT